MAACHEGKKHLMKKLLFAAVITAVLAAALPCGAMAADYPSRPITLVVPLSVGGSTDVIGCIIAQGMQRRISPTNRGRSLSAAVLFCMAAAANDRRS